MEIDKPIKTERKPKPGKCLYCETESPDLVTHIEVEHGILLGDLAALIQKVMLKLTDLENQIKQAHRQFWSKATQLTDHHLSDDFVSIGEALPKVYRSLP